MIRGLQLENWKAYDELELSLDGGTTFVVAHNGVGKSSLVQGAFWTLFGASSLGFPVADAVRGDERSARGIVSLVLPGDREITVKRTVTLDDQDRARERVSYVDGTVETEGSANLSELFESACGLPTDLLGRLLLLDEAAVEGQMNAKQRFSLPAYIGRLFGTEYLDHAAKVSATFARRTEADADRLRKQASRDLDLRVRNRSRAIAALESDVAELEARRSELKSQAEDASKALSAARSWDAYEKQLSAHEATRAKLAAEVGELIGNVNFGEELSPQVWMAHAEAQSAKDAKTTKLARLSAELEILDRSDSLLGRDHDLCPVCRRPLDDEARESAAQAHAEQRLQLEAEIRAAQTEVDADSQTVLDLERLARRIEQTRPPEPPQVDTPATEASELSRLAEAIELDAHALSEELGARRREMRELEAQQQADEETIAANAEAITLYRSGQLAMAASTALRTASTRIQAEQLRPLVDELKLRWKDLWPDRHGLLLQDDGSLAFERGTRIIEYPQFSGAEKTLSLVVLRLLIVQMTSRLGMLWLDEPLEHLDSRNRRVLASMLASAGTQGALGQVVVTTYEEPVVRRLSDQASGGPTRLVYVRSAEG